MLCATPLHSRLIPNCLTRPHKMYFDRGVVQIMGRPCPHDQGMAVSCQDTVTKGSTQSLARIRYLEHWQEEMWKKNMSLKLNSSFEGGLAKDILWTPPLNSRFEEYFAIEFDDYPASNLYPISSLSV